ncbi:hypothetical protein XF30_20090 [Bradyrhizobium sp. SUTN9-2]|uniref:hypothetical protein n=1 Tax=Bradyrhizobium sp. SUTN9-2 TaxID=1167456 RepID=UPI000D642094|nr:hypothetical protein [Bradyrhizobium sp. SUTN9-2]PWE78703.1 hypothetical protein XF30_20090 [Bradyrhizobium sp. SUTN9-2]
MTPTEKLIAEFKQNANEDEKLALEIALANGPYVGSGGMLIPNVARAIAKGIAAGRKLERP